METKGLHKIPLPGLINVFYLFFAFFIIVTGLIVLPTIVVVTNKGITFIYTLSIMFSSILFIAKAWTFKS